MEMIRYLFAVLLLVLSSCGRGDPTEDIEAPDANQENPTIPKEPSSSIGKPLIIYFSWRGHTRTVANIIHELKGSDIVEIEMQKSYSSVYNEVTARVQYEFPSQVRHRISNNMAIYREFIEYNIVHRHN